MKTQKSVVHSNNRSLPFGVSSLETTLIDNGLPGRPARRWRGALWLGVAILAAGSALGADVSLTANDPSGSDSWDEAGRWSNAAAPSSGNNYFTAGFQLRTPNNLAANTTFAGGSLTINGGNVLYKGSGSRTITINNLTLDGGSLIDGNGNTTFTLAGNGITVNTTGFFDSTTDSSDRVIVINPPIAGAGTITCRGNGQIHLINTASTFSGKWILAGNQTRLVADAVLGPVPESYVADAITFSGGVMLNRDTEVTIAANRGITLTAAGGRMEAGWSKYLAIDSVITGPGGLTIMADATPGIIFLNGANTYTGPTVVQNNGWVQVNGSLDAASAVTVQTGGLLLGNGTINGQLTANGNVGPGGLFAAGTLTVNNAVNLNGAVLHVDLSDSTTVGGNVNDLLVVGGDLNLSGTVTVSVTALAGTLAPGPYRLINYTGNLTGSAANLVAAPSRYTITFDTSAAGQVNMTVQDGPPANLVWQGDNLLNLWDSVTPNWLNGGSPDTFRNGDNVLIDDNGANLVQITMTSPFLLNTLVPGSVTVNASKDYTIGGGRLAGPMTLTKQGSGILTLATANANLPNYFDGPIVIQSGRVRAGYVRALGTTAGGTFVRTGGALDVNAQNLGYEPVSIEGDGPDGTGAVVNFSTTGQNNALRVVTMTGDATVGGTARFDIRGVPADTFLNTGGNGYKLTKKGAIQFSLVGVTVDPALGDIDVLEGVLSVESTTTSLGDPAKTLTVAPNAQLFLYNTVNPFDKIISLNGGTTANINNSAGTNTLLGPITLNADSLWTVGGTSLAIYNAIGGNGGVTKAGTSPLYLYGANTYSGATLVSGGTLILGPSASLANSSTIAVGSGATLNVSAVSGFALASGQTLSGSGTVIGNVAAGANTTVIPGTSAGTLTFNGNLSLDGATAVFELGATATTGGGVNDLVVVNGDLNLNSVVTVRINALAPLDTVNPYTIATYTGALNAATVILNVVSDSRYTFVVDPTVPNIIRVFAAAIGTGLEDLTWQGNVPGSETLWDVKTTLNWSNSLAVPDLFYLGDRVKFDDTASSATVDLTATLTPSAVVVSNETQNYVWSGAGKLSGTTGLTKQGAGSLTIANSGVNDNSGTTTIEAGTLQVGNGGTSGNLNSAAIANSGALVFNRSDTITAANVINGAGRVEKQGAGSLTLSGASSAFTGPVAVNAGTLRVGNASALGTGAAGTTVGNGATLDVAGVAITAEPVTVAGDGVGGNGAIVNTVGGTGSVLETLTSVTLAGDTTFGGSGRWDLSGTLAGNGYKLTKVGINELWIAPTAGDTGLGDIDVRQGVLGFEGVSVSSLGDPSKTATVFPGAVLAFYALNNAASPFNKVIAMNGGIFRNANGDNYFSGPVTLSGANTFDVGSTNRQLGVIGGPGSLFKTSGGILILAADNTYSGGTLVSAGVLRLGNGGASGSVTGTIINNSRVDIERSDTYTQGFNLTGTGGMYIRSPNGVVWDGSAAINLGGTVEVGREIAGKLIIQGTANPTVGSLFLGNPANIPGEVLQTGGDVVVTSQLRIGHWPTETSTYTLEGGTITLTATPAGAPAGSSEQAGIFYIGVDGTGIFTQKGGTVRAHGLVLDNRGNTAGDDTFNLQGGTFVVGPSGIATANAANTYVVNLGGGTLASSANWTSVLNMTLTSVENTVDTRNNTNVLAGALSGPGGLVKVGAGALALAGVCNYQGFTDINEGILAVLGSLGDGSGSVMVNNGMLAGTGTINNLVQITTDGVLAPGLSIGTLTINNTLELQGLTLMEINKSGVTRSNDRVIGVTLLTYGGTLTVVASGDALQSGDTFDLFDMTVVAAGSAFATMNLPPLAAGLEWDTTGLEVDGTIKVVATASPKLSIGVSADPSGLVIAWPTIYGDAILQAQTNALGGGIRTNVEAWVDVPGAPNPLILSPVPTNENVFFRLIKTTP